MQKLTKIPMPICGVILGLAALGNLVQSYSEATRLVCGGIAGFLTLLFVIRCIMHPDKFKEEMNNPVTASVSGTFPMALMLLAGYVKPLIGSVAIIVWYIAIILHTILIIYFTLTFLLKLKLPQVFSSWYIVYVGIVVASVTAPAFEALKLGEILFWFGLVTFLMLLVLVTIRYTKEKEISQPAQPLFCIYAAPASLLIAGYVQAVGTKSLTFLMALWTLASILYVISFIKMGLLITKPFSPSWASFTFPFVISAIASKQFMALSAKLEAPKPWLLPIVLFETIVAVILVAYTLIRFLAFIFKSESR